MIEGLPIALILWVMFFLMGLCAIFLRSTVEKQRSAPRRMQQRENTATHIYRT